MGPGLGPLGSPKGYQVPSVRMWWEKTRLTLADATGAEYPVDAIGTVPVVPVAAVKNPAVRAAAAVAATPVAAQAADTGSDAGTSKAPAAKADSAAASRADKHGVNRRAAKN